MQNSVFSNSSPALSRLAQFSHLPIHAVLPELLSALQEKRRVVLEAPPGAGKTTSVPLALLAEDWLAGKKILLLEPRRIAARSAAHFMAHQLGEAVGECVGYRIRFESKISRQTRIEVLTEGILTRLLQDDPELSEVGLIIFDEFHERHLHSDLALALTLDAQQGLRPDLRVLVMSATLDGARLQTFLASDVNQADGNAGAAHVRSEGKSFPVEVQYLPAQKQGDQLESIAVSLARALRKVLPTIEGDVLVFLPGRREIEQCERMVLGLVQEFPELLAVPLHGELGMEQQALAIKPAPAGLRKIVLATNVAESSLTLPGVRVVIDSGLAREPYFDSRRGFASLQDVFISQASATQRAGRAGRVAAGVAIRLYSETRRLDTEIRPEILRSDLAPLALELLGWGAGGMDFLRSHFLDPPSAGSYQQALDLLAMLGALEPQKAANARPQLSAHGKALLRLGAHPRLGNVLLRSRSAVASSDAQNTLLACDIVALIEARDPLLGSERFQEDFALRWQALAAFRRNRSHGADARALQSIDQAAKQWRKRLGVAEQVTKGVSEPAFDRHAVGELLQYAYPDRIAKMRPDAALRYVVNTGGGAQLGAESGLRGEAFLVLADLEQSTRTMPGTVSSDARIRQAAPISLESLRRSFPERFKSAREQRFDAETGAVVAREVQRFDALVLSERSVPAENASSSLLQGLRALAWPGQNFLDADFSESELRLQAEQSAVSNLLTTTLARLPMSEKTQNFRLRVINLRTWLPEAGLPDFSDLALLLELPDWLGPFVSDCSRLSQISEQKVTEALRSQLNFAQTQLLEQQAPERITVPSGMERGLEYRMDGPPVLSVKLQELFGLADTPTIAQGRVRVMLHLLSPGGKPVQVTQDLKNFWNSTYAEVKKEMKGRYPKHPWPDDPWTATATHRAKPRGT